MLHVRTSALFYLRGLHSMFNDAQSRLANIIYDSQTEQTGCDECQSRIKMKQSVNVMSLKHSQLSLLFSFFWYYAYSIILNDRLSNLFIFPLLHFSLC